MALQDILINLGIQVDDSQLKKADSSVSNLVGTMRQVVGAAASAFAVQQIFSFVNAIAQAGDAIGDTAERLGVSTDALQALGYAAERTGSSVEALQSSLQILGRNQGLALQGGAIAGQFRQLGVAFQTAQGQALPLEEVFQNVAERASQARSPAERMAIATRLLGRGAASLGPLLARGADGIRELRAQWLANGGGFTKEGIAAAGEFTDEMQNMHEQLNAVKSAIIVGVMPTVRELAGLWRRFVATLIEVNQKSNVLKIALGLVAVVAAQAAVMSIIAWLPFILILGAVALALDDLYQFFTGGNSVLGEFVDSIYGAGTAASSAASLVDDLTYAGNALADTFSSAFTSFNDDIGFAIGQIGEVFTWITGLDTEAVTLGATLDTIWDLFLVGLEYAKNQLFELIDGPIGQTLAAITGMDSFVAPGTSRQGNAETQQVQAGSVPANTRSAGGDSTNVTANANININGGADSAATAREVARAQSGVNDRAMRRARQELTPRRAA